MHNDRKNYRVYTLPENNTLDYQSNKYHNCLATMIYFLILVATIIYIILQVI